MSNQTTWTRDPNTGARVACVFLAFVFLFSGAAKLSGVEVIHAQFQAWGYAPWFAYVVGAAETLGALLLLFRPGRKIGALMLSVIIAGAMGTHLVAGEWISTLAPLVLLALLVWVFRRTGVAPKIQAGPPPHREDLKDVGSRAAGA